MFNLKGLMSPANPGQGGMARGMKLLNDPSFALPVAAALISGKNNREAFGQGLGMAGIAAGRIDERDKAEGAKNKTIQWLQQYKPDIAAQVAAGMPMDVAMGLATAKPAARKVLKGADGYNYYEDGSRVLPGVERKEDSPLVVNNMGEQIDEERKYLGQAQGKMFDSLISDGLQARSDTATVERLDQLLSAQPTGGAAALKVAAGDFGLDVEGLDELQAARALINKLVPAQRAAGSGPMSDADLELFKQSLPRIINQPGGNKLVIDTLRGINHYRVEQGKIASQYAGGIITAQEAREQLYALENPLSSMDLKGDRAKRKVWNPKTGTFD
jgi:hypothetical protein